MARTLEKRWSVGKWHDHDNYECSFCARSTLSLEIAIEHYEGEHWTRPAPTPLPPVPKLDREGNVIEETE
jgi:ribosomal protein L37AE/L43A